MSIHDDINGGNQGLVQESNESNGPNLVKIDQVQNLIQADVGEGDDTGVEERYVLGLHQYFLGLESRPKEGDVGLRVIG